MKVKELVERDCRSELLNNLAVSKSKTRGTLISDTTGYPCQKLWGRGGVALEAESHGKT